MNYTSVDIEAEVHINGQVYLLPFTVCGVVDGGDVHDVCFQGDKIDLEEVFDPQDFAGLLVEENLQSQIDKTYRKDE